MKVLFVCSGNSYSGLSPIIKSQADSLINPGVEIKYFTINEKGFKGYAKNILLLRKFLKKNKYKIIHAHYGFCGLVALIAKTRCTKLIVSFMGNDLLGDHSRNGKSTAISKLIVCLNKLYAKYVDFVIVKSEEMYVKISNENKFIIPNGTDLNLFKPVDRSFALNRLGWNENFKHILFMSNPDRPEKNFALTKLALESLNIEGIQLHFLKNIPQPNVILYYNAADVCILTSYHEGSPNVIKEAMACNRPIVSTDVGDVKLIFGVTKGCYICSFDPMDVKEKIRLALEFASLSGKTNGRKRIIDLGLDSETTARKIIEVYNKVLKIT